MIFGSAAALAAVVIGLIGAAVVGIYAAIVGEDSFSFLTAVGLGVGGAFLAAVVHFTGAGAAVLGNCFALVNQGSITGSAWAVAARLERHLL
ncbi:hypothetical protein [Thermincola potens]|uniref:hypothetical protein n=1 Tax=Thermincola potens TaxID=863643 RepID=UPI0018DF5D03|nr:hypothetical protein [Thermincola potens]